MPRVLSVRTETKEIVEGEKGRRTTIHKNTVSSGLVRKEIFGTIQLEPISDEESDFYYAISDGEKKSKSYYIAHTRIQTLALLDERYKGSNWL